MTGCVKKIYLAQIFKAAEFSAAGLDSLGVAVALIDGKNRQTLYANGKFLAMTGFTIRQVIWAAMSADFLSAGPHRLVRLIKTRAKDR